MSMRGLGFSGGGDIQRPYDLDWDVIVKERNGNVVVRTDAGQTLWTGPNTADCELALNAALGALPLTPGTRENYGIVKVHGHFHIDGSIELPTWSLLDQYGASYYLNDNSDAAWMVRSADNNHHMAVYGGQYDGNRTNNTGVGGDIYGISIINSTRQVETTFTGVDIYLTSCRDDFLHFDLDDVVFLTRIKTSAETYDRGLYLHTSDSVITDCQLGAFDANIYIAPGSADNKFIGGYCGSGGNVDGGCISINYARRTSFYGMHVDNFVNHGIVVRDDGGGTESFGVHFSNCWVTNQDTLAADNTYSGIRFEDGSNRCTVTGCYIGQKNIAGIADNLKYGIEEVAADAPDWNVFGFNTFYQVQTANVLLDAPNNSEEEHNIG